MAVLTIASLNLRFGIAPDTEAPYDVTAAIGSLDADVVALQEVWRPRTGEAPHLVAAAALGYEVVDLALPRAHNRSSPPLVRATDGPLGTWWGVAVLSRRPIGPPREFAFASIPLDAAERRALLVSTAGVTIVTPHLTYRPWGSPFHLARLRRILAELEGTAGEPAVVLGDLNMWGPVVAAFGRGWQRPVRGRTWPAHRPHSQIDHVLVSPGAEVHDAEVLGPVGSDHRPVRIRLRVDD